MTCGRRVIFDHAPAGSPADDEAAPPFEEAEDESGYEEEEAEDESWYEKEESEDESGYEAAPPFEEAAGAEHQRGQDDDPEPDAEPSRRNTESDAGGVRRALRARGAAMKK